MSDKKVAQKIKMTRSIELACFWAYKSYQESAKNKRDSLELIHIRQDKFDHIMMLEYALRRLHFKQNPASDLIFECIGRSISLWRKYIHKNTGNKMIQFLENRCKKYYVESAVCAKRMGLPYMAQLLYYMGAEQKRHGIVMSNKVQA